MLKDVHYILDVITRCHSVIKIIFLGTDIGDVMLLNVRLVVNPAGLRLLHIITFLLHQLEYFSYFSLKKVIVLHVVNLGGFTRLSNKLSVETRARNVQSLHMKSTQMYGCFVVRKIGAVRSSGFDSYCF